MSGGFELLPHTADVLVKAWGDSLEEAFGYAALGMFEVMTDTSKVACKEEREVEVEGIDVENLLYNWLEELIIIFDSESLLVSNANVKKIWNEDGVWKLKAKICGESYDPERHESRALVKAATYHMMKIWKEDGKHFVQFVVDI